MANMRRIATMLCVGLGSCLFMLGCEGDKATGTGTAPAGTTTAAAKTTAAAAATTAAAATPPAGDTPCSAVVDKLASYEAGSGEPEKKLWGKMCEAMPPAARACIVASKTKEERDKCVANEKLK